MLAVNQDLAQILETRAALQPDRLAYRVVDQDDMIGATIDHASLRARVAMAARNLAEAGLAGRHVALMSATSIDYVVSFFAVLWSGGVVVPMAAVRTSGADKGEAALRKFNRLLIAADVAGIIVDPAMADRLASCRDRCPALQAIPIIDTGALARTNRPADRQPPQDIAVIQFTSGSTSDPKGVCVTHRNFIGNAQTMAHVFAATDDDVMVHWLPLYHDMGLIGGIIAPLCNAIPSTIIPASKFASDPGFWIRVMSRFGGTMSTAPNFAYQLCADRMTDSEIAALDLRRWKAAICGSEPIQAKTLAAFAARFAAAGFSARAVFPTYGLAEATIYVSGGPVLGGMTAHDFDRQLLEVTGRAAPARPGQASRVLVSCGNIPDEHDIIIVDPASQQACGDGQVGEVWLRGPGVAKGYWNNPEATAQNFGREMAPWGGGFLATGDLGFLLDGNLTIVGRLRDLIILDGVNHFPQDIENAACAGDDTLAGCANAAFQADDGPGGVILVQELRSRDPAGIQDAVQTIRRRVAQSEQIALQAIIPVPRGAIVKTSSGKVARRLVFAQWRAGTLKSLLPDVAAAAQPAQPIAQPAQPIVAPAANAEASARIALLWREVLGHADFSTESLFFEVGGTSIQLATLHAMIQQAFAVEFPLIDLLENATVTTMARHIAVCGHADGADSLMPIAPQARSLPISRADRFARRMSARAQVAGPGAR